jgi:hypothetical protein
MNRDPYETAFSEQCEMDLLKLKFPALGIKLETAWYVNILNPGRPHWKSYVFQIFAYCKLPREFGEE